ncbi:MAG: STAS domain-containing protein [Armatimonadota bacterium]|nr:STAS domain-containing protein [bacterium]
MPKARIFSHRIHYHVVNGYAVVRPEGACDEGTTEALASFANSPLVESCNLIIDLSHVEYVETPGYRWIVRQFRQLETSGKALVVVGLPKSVRRAFELLRLDSIVPTAETVTEAMHKLSSTEPLALIA